MEILLRTKERQKWRSKGEEATGKEKEGMRKEKEWNKKGRKKEEKREGGREGGYHSFSFQQIVSY